MELTSDNVHEVLMECLFKEGEDTSRAIIVHGVKLHIGFHPERLEDYKPDIADLVDELPKEFKDGWSFLNACMTKDGRQWGEHEDVDALLCLGLATGKITLLLERELWQALPGSLPYFQVK